MELTVFEDVKAQTAHRWEQRFEELAAYLNNPQEYSAKSLCPLMSGVSFGDQQTNKGSLRSDDNAVSIHWVIGDYDGGVVSVADAQAMLSWAGIKAIIYTSASHTEAHPRWRVVVPLSLAYYPAGYREFVGRINAALGGILARESFTLSQSYYFGQVTGAAYECVVSEGQCVDLVQIEPQYPAPVATKPFQVTNNIVSDETIEELRSALAAIPSDERPVWIEVGQALKPLGDTGLDLWEEWSAKSDKHDPERDRRTWDGLSGDRTGYQSVFAKAQRLGWENPRKSVPINLIKAFGNIDIPKLIGDHGVVKTARLLGTYVAAGALPEERAFEELLAAETDDATRHAVYAELEAGKQDHFSSLGGVAATYDANWKEALTAHVEEMNKTYASVLIGGQHRIMRQEPGEVHFENRKVFAFTSLPNFVASFSNDLIQIGEKEVGKKLVPVKAPLGAAWAKNPKARSYPFGVIFLPGREVPQGYFNTWLGFAVEPKANTELAARIYWHISHIVCRDNQELYTYVIKWIAYTIQNPDKPAGAALVMRGGKGSGKGMLGHFLRYIWGNHGIHLTNPKHLVGQFNGHLADVCLLFADEAFYSGDKSHENILKSIVTEPTQMIERKGIDGLQQPNYLKIIMSANGDFVVRASSDERRFCVLDVSNERVRDREYFGKLEADIKNPEVQAAFLYDMMSVDLTGFHTGDIPETSALKEQRLHSMQPHQKWLVNVLADGVFTTRDNVFMGGWLHEASTAELFTFYVDWCDMSKIGEYNRISKFALGRYLSTIFRQIQIGHERKRGFALGTVEEARLIYQTKEKVEL